MMFGGIRGRCLVVLAAVALAAGMLGVHAVVTKADTAEIPVFSRSAGFTIGSETMTVDGRNYQMDVVPYIATNGRVEVPARYLANVLGYTVTWDQSTKTVRLARPNSKAYMELTVGVATATYSDGLHKESIKMDTVPALKDPPGRVFVPVIFVTRALGYGTGWNPVARTLILMPPGSMAVYAPDIYLYPPHQEQVRVQFGDPSVLTASAPGYPAGGWKVVATPSGRIYASGRTYGYLWYETVVNAAWQTQSGWLVRGGRNGFRTWAQHNLPSLGLNSKECGDFIAYWRTRLPQAPCYLVAPQPESLVDRAMPLRVTPAPRTTLRVWLFVEPLSHPAPISPPPAVRPLVRHNLSVVEWGVIMAARPF